jgi:hypothetical protein
LESEREDSSSVLDSLFIEEKIRPALMNILSKVNQHAWTNELSQANGLLKRIDRVILGLGLLKDTSDVSMKYFQTTSLLTQRINQRANLEFNILLKEIKRLIGQKQYWQAYQLLKDDNLFLRQTLYQSYIERLEKEIEQPALFQGKMLSVEQNLALGDYLLGFTIYEQAYIYFLQYEIKNYGLSCDSLFVFIMKHEQQKFLLGACNYYIKQDNCLSALDVMMYLVDLGYKSEDLQAELGQKMKESSYSFAMLSDRYTFTKKHNSFLEHYQGKFKTFWYHFKKWKFFRWKKG